ncbi:hypothetical protein ES703_06360 [subsurface metagenome]
MREFVLPGGTMVAEALEGISAGADGQEGLIWRCWDWVCREIKYPPLPYPDYHREEAFLRGNSLPWLGFMPIKRSTKYEFWQFPFETIDHRLGDCEDTSILLCSLLRNPLSADKVHVAVGTYAGYGHGWIRLVKDGEKYVIETTLARAVTEGTYQVLELPPYRPLLYFNDEQAFEVNGGLAELGGALREDVGKLQLIAEAYRWAEFPET